MYRTILTASVELTTGDRSRVKELSIVQTSGSPRTALLSALDASDKELQLAALSCLATLFQNLVDTTFFTSSDEQPATARFLKFAAHSERRFHEPTLLIVDSISRYGTSAAVSESARSV